MKYNEFDYLSLLQELKDYNYPRNRIRTLLLQKKITRVKKGIYVRELSAASLEVLANMIYGPSYISLEYALAGYGLIPEAVRTLTCVTSSRNRIFDTPAGRFSYIFLRQEYYPHGVTIEYLPDGRSFLIATAEKALIDRVYFEKGILTKKEMRAFLFDSLRLDAERVASLNTSLLESILAHYSEQSMKILREVVSEQK